MGNLKIGLAFSGGGYRAAAFDLGLLTLLDKITIGSGSLLNSVFALSTVSGGTITGARYALGIKRGESLPDIYRSLYYFMTDVNLLNESLLQLLGKSTTAQNSLVCALAQVYNQRLFDGACLGTLMSSENPIHLKYVSFNATEFTNALQFRFQWVDKQQFSINNKPSNGFIGNNFYRIPEYVSKHIRFADVLAASSCFPGGLEPINFPIDFELPKGLDFDYEFDKKSYPVGLMDGGIVDNQGIEPLLLVEKRLAKLQKKVSDKNVEQNILDLLIFSDVNTPFMDDYQPTKPLKKSWWRKLSPLSLIIGNISFMMLAIGGFLYAFICHNLLLMAAASIAITVGLLFFVIGRFVISLPTKFQVPEAFLKPLRLLLKVKLGIYENLILNRTNSLLKMTSEVFLKHIRRLNYNAIYQDASWLNRRLMIGIYELGNNYEALVAKSKAGKLDSALIPSEAIVKVSNNATSMGTTLWFTQQQLSNENMLNDIIACGQFTMCWNLLEYIIVIKADSRNTNENHQQLIGCYDQLMELWQRFNDNPHWLVNEFNKARK